MNYDKLEKLKKACAGAVAKTDRERKDLYLPLWMHLADTAGVMEQLAKRWISPSLRDYLCSFFETEEDFYEICMFLGFSHDFGKATALFQSRILSNLAKQDLFELQVPSLEKFINPGILPHALASETLLEMQGVSKSIASIAGAHHGKSQEDNRGNPEDEIEANPLNYCGGSAYLKDWKDFWQEMYRAIENLAFSDSGLKTISLPMYVDFLLTGLLIMADWIASNPYYFPLIDIDETGKAELYPNRIKKGLGKINLPEAWQSMTFNMDEDSFQDEFGFYPNEVQQEVLRIANSSTDLGLVILEAQMGVGKTEAALACAEILAGQRNIGGLFFGLPTQATANGLFPRVTAWAQEQSENDMSRLSIQLAHRKAFLNENYQEILNGDSNTDDESESGLIVHRWMKGRKQSLLSDFVVGTVDQVLMSALNTKHVMLRQLGLAGKVVIIDEVHSYDPYMNTYLDRALEWLGAYNVPVILLSATLPGTRRNALLMAYLKGKGLKVKEIKRKLPDEGGLAYPLISWTENTEISQREISLNTENRKVRTEFISMEEEQPQILNELRGRLKEGGCAGIIVNTVQRAQQMAQFLQSELEGFTVLTFHSRFTSRDRARIEKEILERVGKNSNSIQRNRIVVVGTQVLEQSLDIDFDLLFTDLAPMDLILQRIGRLHRHAGRVRPKRVKKPVCFVLDRTSGFEEGAESIYGSWLLLRTRESLEKEILLPAQISSLIQKVYKLPEIDDLNDQQKNFYEEFTASERGKKGRAKGYLLAEPSRRKCTMDGSMANSLFDSEQGAQATVREGDTSIPVILVKMADERVTLPSKTDIKLNLSIYSAPTAEEAKEILLSEISFPVGKYGEKIIEELEKRTGDYIAWQENGLLKDALILTLDDSNCVELCGQCYEYSKEFGLFRKEK